MHAPETSFAASLVRENRLDELGFSRFLFYPGMLFDSPDKWWGRPGFRHSRHEGVDLCLFETAAGGLCRLDSAAVVPMAGDSRVVRIMDDFLGRTVVAARRPPDAAERVLLTLYAHIRPDPGLTVGDRVADGSVFARIAPIGESGPPLLPHLHLSLAWAESLPDCRQWTWKMLNRCGSRSFLDPLERLGIPCRVIPFSFESGPAAEFIPCRRALSASSGEMR
jgi:hypothetical protein